MWGLPKKGVLAIACISFTDADVERASAFLGLSADEFRKKYKVQNGMVNVTHGPCPFLSKNNRCSIHDAKPERCRDWPNNGATPEQIRDCRGHDGKED
jgi:Fe-S-cluster containining protein